MYQQKCSYHSIEKKTNAITRSYRQCLDQRISYTIIIEGDYKKKTGHAIIRHTLSLVYDILNYCTFVPFLYNLHYQYNNSFLFKDENNMLR